MLHAATNRIDDPDVWWVAAAGRETLQTHHVPRTNLFSFVDGGLPWIMHEWLFGPPYAAALEHFGPSAFNAIALLVLALELGLVLAATLGRARHAAAGLVLALAAMLFFGGRFESARPAGVSLVFALAMATIAFRRHFGARHVVAAGLVELVWANSHGSFPVGVVLLLTAAAEQPHDRRWRLGAAGLCAGLTLVNPYGFGLYGLVWEYVQGTDGVYGAIKASVGEFGSIAHANWIDGSTGPGGSILVVAVFALAAVGLALHPAYRARGVLGALLFLLAAFHVRYIQLAGLLTCVLLVPAVDELLESRSRPPPAPLEKSARRSKRAKALEALEEKRSTRDSPRLGESRRWKLVVGAALVGLPAALGVGLFAREHAERSPDEWIDSTATTLRGLAPPAAIALVPDGSNLWVPFRSGGIALWYGAPRGVRVFFDPRNDCYSAETFETSVLLELGRLTPDQVLSAFRKTGTNALLVEKRRPLTGFLMLSNQKDWKPGGQSGEWWLFRSAS
jgi:hypothetical protein